jgi:hypothetical protein
MRYLTAALIVASGLLLTETPTFPQSDRPGVPPQGFNCPLAQPIKGNFTTYSGERCIYHVPGGGFYGKTRPERCYLTEADAVRDGCRRSKR